MSSESRAAADLPRVLGLFHLFPGHDGPFSRTDNIGAVIDRWWLGRSYPGYYTTINFISAISSTLFGAWAGMLVMSSRTRAAKLWILAIGALIAFTLGLEFSEWAPIVKRLWTPSFVLYSTGWVLVMFMSFVWLFDKRTSHKLAFPGRPGNESHPGLFDQSYTASLDRSRPRGIYTPVRVGWSAGARGPGLRRAPRDLGLVSVVVRRKVFPKL